MSTDTFGPLSEAEDMLERCDSIATLAYDLDCYVPMSSDTPDIDEGGDDHSFNQSPELRDMLHSIRSRQSQVTKGQTT